MGAASFLRIDRFSVIFLWRPPLGQGLAASCRASLAFFQTERPNTDVGARVRTVGLSGSEKRPPVARLGRGPLSVTRT